MKNYEVNHPNFTMSQRWVKNKMGEKKALTYCFPSVSQNTQLQSSSQTLSWPQRFPLLWPLEHAHCKSSVTQYNVYNLIMGFPCGSAGKESACNVGNWVWSLGWEDSLEKGKAAHSSILENAMDYVVHAVVKSWTQLSDFHFLFITYLYRFVGFMCFCLIHKRLQEHRLLTLNSLQTLIFKHLRSS